MTRAPARKPTARKAADRPPEAGPPLLEWIVSGLGLLIVVGVLGVLLYEVVSGPDRPPVIEVRVVSVERSGSGWRVEAEATNDGDAAAAQVHVLATLGGEPPETAEVVLDYLPGAGERPLSLRFESDPRGRPLDVHAIGWIDP